MTSFNEDRLKETMRSLHPVTAVPASLDERITRLAARADAHPNRPYTAMRIALGLSVGTAIAAATGIFLLTSRPVLARDLRLVSENLGRTTGYHMRLTGYHNGQPVMTDDIFVAPARWRTDVSINGRRLTQIKAQGLFWNIDPARRTGWYQKDTERVPLSFDVERFQSEMYGVLRDSRAQDLGSEIVDGRRLQKVALPAVLPSFPLRQGNAGRSVVWIDRKTMLPAYIEGQVRQNGNWTVQNRCEYDFRLPIRPELFTIPRNIRTYSVNDYGAEVGRRFSYPLQAKSFPGLTIALRDFQVNENGDVFVLYTDGSTRDRDSQSYPHITDDRKTEYAGTAGGIEPFMYHQQKEMSRGMTIGSETLRGVCVVPVYPPTGRWQARTFTIRIDTYQEVGKKQVTRSARFTVAVPRPTAKLLPAYADDLAALSLSGGDEKQFKEARGWARRAYFYNHSDWPGMLVETDREIREGSVDFWTYHDRALALGKLGRTSEALATLQDAEKQDTLGVYGQQLARIRQEIMGSK